VNAAKIRLFWDWFRARADRIRNDPAAFAPEIQDMLGRLHEGLAWEMGGPNGDRYDFTLRTERSELRHLTHWIVATAPKIEGWNIYAWKPAHNAMAGGTIRIEDEGPPFEIEKFSATVEADPRYPFLHLTVSSPQFVPGDTPEIHHQNAPIGLLVLDMVLGEKLVEDGIEAIAFLGTTPLATPARDLSAEVERQLRMVRSRSYPPAGPYLGGEGQAPDGSPMHVILPVLCFADMVSHPWRVDVDFELRSPDARGMPESDELRVLHETVPSIMEALVRGRSAQRPMHFTGSGHRSLSFYVDDPIEVEDPVRAVAHAEGYRAEVDIVYDPRWRRYRDYAPPLESPAALLS
jgi:hypothetical protein